jgi:hypothetical protein
MRPKLFATINKTKVYHVHKNGYGQGRETVHWFSTAANTPDAHEKFVFDVRDLGCHVDEYNDSGWLDRYETKCKRYIRAGLKNGSIKAPN